jgi:hypothetical protein
MMWKNKIKVGVDYDELSGVIDLFPTILDICEIEYENSSLPVHGRSIWPIIKGKTPDDWEERRYFDNTNFYLRQRKDINIEKPQMHHIALHYKNYKMIRGNNALYGGADSVYYELYDLDKDPMETDNIVEKDVNISAQLIIELENWYNSVLKNGRAFGQAIYEVGNWEEPNSPINLDGARDVWGSLAEGNQVGFRIGNWTSNNSGINFEIDVKEKGVYQVELGYSCQESDLGSEFKVYTEYDTASIFIHDVESSVSESLILPVGRQVLNIELIKLGQGLKGFDILRKLLVHRIPEEKDSGVLKNASMILKSADGTEIVFKHSSATADFLHGETGRQVLEVKADTEVSIRTMADNEDQIETITLYLGFEEIEMKTEAPFAFSMLAVQPGRQTINLELLSETGIVTSVHGEILVFQD